ncbi:MAG: ATP-binding protein [Acidobacteriota bacterium]
MSPLTQKRLAIAAIVFALFIVFDIALFGWLIFNSLSQREIDKIFLETRAEAEPLAKRLEEQALSPGQDLYVAASIVKEDTYLQSFPTHRALIRRLVIRNKNGTVVYQEESKQELPVGDGLGGGSQDGEASGDRLEIPSGVSEDLKEVEVPIGELGTMSVALSGLVLEERINDLRSDLIRQTSVIGGLTLTLLVGAFAAIWVLFQRSRRLEEQAAEAERMAYIGTLASGLAHEIRNPLNSLNLNMQLLEEEAREQGSGSSNRLLSITRSELRRLERLATDFLSYAKPRPLQLEEVSALDLLHRVRDVMRGETEARGAVVEIEDSSAGAMVRVDRGQINQLLINLTQNALAASAESSQALVKLVARRRDDEVELEVIDNGHGISKEDQERMFELFFSTRKGGTGLGLAIVKRIAKTHDAAIEVESAPGEGATVRLRLALASLRQPADIMASNSSSVVKSSGSSTPQTMHMASMSRPPSHSKV